MYASRKVEQKAQKSRKRPRAPHLGLALVREAAGQLHSGDIELSVPTPGGPIVTSGGEWVGEYAGRVFDEGIFPLAPPFVTGSPGFDSSAGTFPAGSLIRFDFVKELLYWNGTALAPPVATMMVDYQDVRFASITGADTAGAPGFVITSVPSNGSFHEHLEYALPCKHQLCVELALSGIHSSR